DPGNIFRGTVSDCDTRTPLSGAYIYVIGSDPPMGSATDSRGRFSISLPPGRHSVRISYLGYEELIMNNVQIASGRETSIDICLREKLVTTADVIVKAGGGLGNSINPMAILSTTRVRTDDALRYAGGFYDPSRIVNAFAGVITSNSDQSNDIVIRGNSSRGLLWRLEGTEIPNPNHFSDGQGGSGGAFSAISSNVIDNFDFFTGAFPAEYGNAFSGVMDLNLRKGNTEKYEFAFQTGMIGAEVFSEGPLPGKSDASYLVDARYTNFGYLARLGLIDLGSANIPPETKDITFNINMPAGKAGTFSVFAMAGTSSIGTEAIRDTSAWTVSPGNHEELESQGSVIGGIRHLLLFPDRKTYTRITAAYTYYKSSFREGYLDTTYNRHDTYTNSYEYPSFKGTFILNHKLNGRNTVRAGANLSLMKASMSNLRVNQAETFDTLVLPQAKGEMIQGYVQWKHRTLTNLEFNTGLHYLNYTLSGAQSLEPRAGLKWEITPSGAFTAGIGFHSRAESMAVYSSLVKNEKGERGAFNDDLDLSRAFHTVAGIDLVFRNDIRARIEGYMQLLYNIPIVNRMTSQYSTLNSAERLPDSELENEGTGRNNGVELTIEKAFTNNWYFLVTGSLFNSTYVAGDQRRYNTYYNTRFVSNILGGKDFPVGRNRKNTIGINAKYMIRGGYRYTPVDIKRSLKYKRILYENSATYESQLPAFMRLDAGISFRKNNPGWSWIVMLDVQNLTDRENIFRKRFSWENGKVVEREEVSMGLVPVFNLRVEF
ncbi:MAG: TonB-dependent receptor, partial [Bacteroidales bacterium]|nr:TonB-dependent receptor [Bacteroidales bacterium]